MQKRLQLHYQIANCLPHAIKTINFSLPITAFGSVPKAQTHGEPDGTWNLEKLHLELKYLGRKLADAKLQETKYL